jgi:hypothetical protein
MLALVAKKKLRARARSLGCPAARAPFFVFRQDGAHDVKYLCVAGIYYVGNFTGLQLGASRTKMDAASLLAGITARVFLSRRRATRSTMVRVTISPAGSLKLPPRPLRALRDRRCIRSEEQENQIPNSADTEFIQIHRRSFQVYGQ